MSKTMTGPPILPMQLHYIGSFQRGTWFVCEDPLEEVWSHVARFGASDFVAPRMDPSTPVEQRKGVVDYAVVRTRQSLEFRKAAGGASLLTAPLPLYYSFLNLLRAFLALRTGHLATRAHGLTFVKRADVLSCGAKLTKGTFGDYLGALSSDWSKGTVVTLKDALSRSVEMWIDYVDVVGDGAHVVPVNVDAYIHGPVFLRFHSIYGKSEDFEERWRLECPSLKDVCVFDPDQQALRVTALTSSSSESDIVEFCGAHLQTDLIHRVDPLWHVTRETDPTLVFPRPAYYFLAMFVLASIVRYQPELMLDVADPSSKWNWLLSRFVAASERFFPQLMLMWLYERPLYFSGVA